MEKSLEPIYPMGVARRLTGLSERQIRYWEEQGLIQPARSPGGHRLYSQADLAFLRRAAALRQRGYGLDDILAARREAERPRPPSDAALRFPSPGRPTPPVRWPTDRGSPPATPGSLPRSTQDRWLIINQLERRQKDADKRERDSR